jgi:hypothetical protein
MKATSQSFQGALGRMLIVSMGQRLNYLEIPVCAGRDDFVAIAIKLGSETTDLNVTQDDVHVFQHGKRW